MMTSVALGFVLISLDHILPGQAAHCPAVTKCTCPGDIINCYNKGLTSVPTFTTSSNTYSSVNLEQNQIEELSNSAFKNLDLVANHGNGTVYINLRRNRIISIDPKAFAGLENIRIALDLRENKLIRLPAPLVSLKNLTELQVDNVESLDASVMIYLGFSLTTFGFGMNKKMTTWPPELEYLIRLKSLSISNMDLAHFPFESFRGFTQVLESLRISQSNFSHSPDAICTLTKVKSVEIISVNLLSVVDFIPTCVNQVRSLRSLYYESVVLRTFPYLFDTFPEVTNITVTDCELVAMEDNVVPANKTVTELRLSNNNFRQIPYEIMKMKNLRALDLSNNNILSIEENDMSGLVQLEVLNLAGNPLVYMAMYALQNLGSLYSLDLGSTNLTTIPQTIRHLHKLQRLDLQDTKIECTCDLLWFKDCTLSTPSVSGDCYPTEEGLDDFLYNRLDLCPADPNVCNH